MTEKQELIEEEITEEVVGEDEKQEIKITFGGKDGQIGILVPSDMPIINVLGMLEYVKDIIISNGKSQINRDVEDDM